MDRAEEAKELLSLICLDADKWWALHVLKNKGFVSRRLGNFIWEKHKKAVLQCIQISDVPIGGHYKWLTSL